MLTGRTLQPDRRAPDGAHHARARNEAAHDDSSEPAAMDPFGPTVDLSWFDVDPGREPVRDRRAETTREKVRNERAGGGGQGAYEDDLRELRYIAARAVSEERDDHIGRGGQRNAGLLDRDDAEEDDVLVLQDRKEEKSDRVADDRRQSHCGAERSEKD